MTPFFEKLKSGLSKTRHGFVDSVIHVVTGKARIDEEVVEELESVLVSADLGFGLATGLIEQLRTRLGVGQATSAEAIVACLKDFLLERLDHRERADDVAEQTARPYVLMVVGVNGVGKTTTIAKLANRFRREGQTVLVAAADTFRAAAAEQLEIWAQRAQVEIVRTQPGADPSSLVFDALTAAKSRGLDTVIIDTAGRLHTKTNLMNELKKMVKVMQRVVPDAPHDVFLVLDATTGQNGLRQAETFLEAAGVTGLVVTKLDGTAKGGIIFSIKEKLGIPVRFIGVGEGMDDLQPFDPAQFVEALFD